MQQSTTKSLDCNMYGNKPVVCTQVDMFNNEMRVFVLGYQYKMQTLILGPRLKKTTTKEMLCGISVYFSCVVVFLQQMLFVIRYNFLIC
jgi:hypothetical protein